MKMFKKYLLVVVMSLISVSAHAADWTPFQLSFINPVQIFPEETKVQGVRLNLIYGVNKEVNGIDYGSINRTTGTTNGVQVGAFPIGGVNITKDLYGAQLIGILGGVNVATGDVTGIQVTSLFAGVNSAGNVTGVQLSGGLAGVNIAEDVSGVQLSGMYIGVNIAKNTKGVQIGTLLNKATTMEGLQIGIVNVCNRMKGVQIGLINVITESKLPFFPIINASF
jgi:hypothetical protein